MGLYVDSRPELANVNERQRWPRQATVRLAIAAVVLVELIAFVIPQTRAVWELRSETADLQERQSVATLSAHGATGPGANEGRRIELPKRLDPRDLLPAISMLASQAGMEIVAIKQSAIDKQGPARRIHLRTRGAYGQVVEFLERVASAISLSQVEDLTLRRAAVPPPQDGGIELEYVLSVTSTDSSAARGSSESNVK